jgi:NAD+ synthase (glutamine-hydrolysing)
VKPVFRSRLLDPRGREDAPSLPVVAVSEPVARERDDVRPPVVADVPDEVGEVYEALTLATRDYVRKNGFSDVVIGLSGGVDSSLVTAIAVDAVGADHVHTVAMPSRFSSDHSLTDADRLAANFDVDHREIAIEPAHAAFLDMLAPSYEGTEEGLAEENLQPRIRGTLLMALSNKFSRWLVLTTGNKSESAVGYSTLYGDTAGGYAVIKDVAKLLVYELCRWRNAQAGRGLIPEAVLTSRCPRTRCSTRCSRRTSSRT